MCREDKDYLFKPSTRKLPSPEEVAEMVTGFIPWSSPVNTEPHVSFTMKGFDALIASHRGNTDGRRDKTNMVAHSVKHLNRLNPLKLPAGYTYWGQWIAHDIVAPTNPAQNHYSSRHVTPQLNMDSLYGEVEALPSHLYINELGFFRLPDNDWDCLRDNSGSPVLPEPRNNDNAIVLQFHGQWQRIHNRILATLCDTELPHLCDDASYFHQARRFTVALFHRLVKQEWLSAVLDQQVYHYYFATNSPAEALLEPSDELRRVPYEFSHAAFRFGHSMVRETYKLRDADSFNLKALMTHQPFNGKAIPAIDWRHFFGDYAQEVQPINILVVAGMANIPVSRNIAERNIVAGMNAGLMTSQECKQFLETHHPELFRGTGLTTDDAESLLEELKIDTMNQASLFYQLHQEGRLPLWPYLLTESAVHETNPGHRMGKLGSVIIADVMRWSMMQVERTLLKGQSVRQDIAVFENALCRSLGVSSPDKLTMSDLLCERS